MTTTTAATMLRGSSPAVVVSARQKTNGGSRRSFAVRLKPRSIVAATFPAALVGVSRRSSAAVRARGNDEDGAPGVPAEAADVSPAEAARAAKSAEFSVKKGGGARRADSTDAVATFLTRRFGIAGGLAWLGILTFGVISEQLKTRREVREAREGTKDVAKQSEVTTASGLRYTDLRIGGRGRGRGT